MHFQTATNYATGGWKAPTTAAAGVPFASMPTTHHSQVLLASILPRLAFVLRDSLAFGGVFLIVLMSADAAFSVAAWPIENAGAFRHFRVYQTGLNSSNANNLMCTGIELYGTLVEEE